MIQNSGIVVGVGVDDEDDGVGGGGEVTAVGPPESLFPPTPNTLGPHFISTGGLEIMRMNLKYTETFSKILIKCMGNYCVTTESKCHPSSSIQDYMSFIC